MDKLKSYLRVLGIVVGMLAVSILSPSAMAQSQSVNVAVGYGVIAIVRCFVQGTASGVQCSASGVQCNPFCFRSASVVQDSASPVQTLLVSVDVDAVLEAAVLPVPVLSVAAVLSVPVLSVSVIPSKPATPLADVVLQVAVVSVPVLSGTPA